MQYLYVSFISGNIVEWCQPDDINLEGVEFKAMASGAHTVLTDFMWASVVLM